MDAVQFHLLLNHIPILGVLFGFIVLVYGFVAKNKSVENTGLVSLVVVALMTIPAYLTGEEAEHAVEKIAGISEHFLEEHEELSEIGLWMMTATGILALISLFVSKLFNRKALLSGLTLISAVASFVMMIIIGNHGGKIRHTELIDQVNSVEKHSDHVE